MFKKSGQLGLAVVNYSAIAFTQNSSTEVMRINDLNHDVANGKTTTTYKLNVNSFLIHLPYIKEEL